MHKPLLPSLKALLLGKINYIFYVIFALLILGIFLLYFSNLSTFALTAKNFTAEEAGYPSLLLTERYPGTETHLFLLVLFLMESFVIWKIIRFGKKVQMRALFVYSAFMQMAAIVGLIIIASAPEAVVFNLQNKADKEITSAITLLNNPIERDKRGILSSTDAIAQKINTAPFENIHISESSPQKSALISILSPGEEKTTFYKAIAIPSAIKNNLNIYDLKFNILLFPNNNLVVNHFGRTDLEALLPALSKKMLVSKFGSLIHNGSLPRTSFLNEADYIVHQKQQEEVIKKEYEEYIVYLDAYVKDADRITAANQNIIDSYPIDQQKAQKIYDDYVAKWGGWYEKCKAQRGDDPACEEGKATYESNVRKLQDSKTHIEENKNEAEKNKALTIEYKNSSINKLAIARQNYQDFLKNPVTAELQEGVFNSPDNVYIKYDDKDEKQLTHYLNILLHEYLHYYSYNPNSHLEPFLDEGLTEYLKTETIKKHIEPDLISHSYPEEVTIIKNLLKHLPEDSIIRSYFHQDSAGLEKTFTTKYPPSKYQTLLQKAKALYYTPREDTKTREGYVEEIMDLLKI